MPYIVPPMPYTPVGVVRSPSCLWSENPLVPTRAAIAPNAGCHPDAVRVNVSSVALVLSNPGACTTITWRVAVGIVVSRLATLPAAPCCAAALVAGAFVVGALDGVADRLADGEADGKTDADGTATSDVDSGSASSTVAGGGSAARPMSLPVSRNRSTVTPVTANSTATTAVAVHTTGIVRPAARRPESGDTRVTNSPRWGTGRSRL